MLPVQGKGYTLRLMALLRARKLVIQRALPSFFGMIKVPAIHLECVAVLRMLSSTS